MEELGTEKVLMDERMGHADGSMSALYAQVTDGMRLRLRSNLTELWEASLKARRTPSSLPGGGGSTGCSGPVSDRSGRRISKIFSQISPNADQRTVRAGLSESRDRP